jgi:hypothetical protein
MKDLKNKHSGAYMFSVLLETLKQYDIEYNITRYLFFIIPYIIY